MKNIIYLAIDKLSILKEIKTSILSLSYVAKDNLEDYSIYIYTNIKNAEEYFKKLNNNLKITFKNFDYSIYREIYNYIYISKIITLIYFLEEYNEPVIFMDSDTFFYNNPKYLFDSLKDDTVIMNFKEVVIEEHMSSLKKKSDIFYFCMDTMKENKILINEEEIIINKKYSLWNSGVIGVTPSQLTDLYKSIELCNYIFREYKIRTAEQISLSCIFQYKNIIKSGDEVVFHYYFLKDYCTSLEEIFELEDKIDFYNIIEELVTITKKRYKCFYTSLLEKIHPSSIMYKHLSANSIK